ncbi:hypothetical protein B0H17DRAFT_1209560 [Mycena rosella]|uniref:Uncharacterized protein n=1 Tax=Mycena rosella TaxID=1033263 RepID=A0AAD7CY16_MYCRO|nr:hypothetical protein B0H17DRAFT_1209560 [Mycena rosella]
MLLTYMMVYKALMEMPSLGKPAPAAEKCVGTYMGNAAIVQSLSKAGLPYCPIWSLRRTPQYMATSQTTYSTDLKIEVIHKVCHSMQWYNYPFEAQNTSAASSSSQAAMSASSSQAGTPAIRGFLFATWESK